MTKVGGIACGVANDYRNDSNRWKPDTSGGIVANDNEGLGRQRDTSNEYLIWGVVLCGVQT